MTKRRDAKGQLRDYKKEAAAAKRPDRVKDNLARKAARRMLEKEGRVHKHDGKEVDHKKMLGAGGSNKRSNLQVLPRGPNRRKQPKHK